jgi:predicted RNA binding protein YcfA (HicA-like mRNA interferase family)
VNTRKLLRRLDSGSIQNVRFADFRRLIEAFGFQLARVVGSHHIFCHPEIPEVVNLQEVGGQAKLYQVRQFLRLVKRYDLELEDDA